MRNCCLDEQDVCLGCGRTFGEILEWAGADAQRRRSVLQVAQQRLAAIRQRR